MLVKHERRPFRFGVTLLAGLLGCLSLMGCKDEKTGVQAPTVPAVEVAVEIVTPQKVLYTTELAGRTSGFQIAEVRPQVSGIIQKRFFEEGADVKAGDVLYQIDPATYQANLDSAKANLARAEANVAPARLKMQRFKDLVNISAVSKQEFEDAEAAYKQALADFQLVAGRAPLPPKYTFGYWWSRYWQYSDNEFVDLVQKLKSVDIPIDVLIVDMDWHETWGLRKKNPAKDEYGQRIGWTGYTWQKELFPSPANFLRWTENEQLKVALNLHPASGIQPYEDVYEPFTREYGWTEKGKSVPFHIDEQKWADAYFKTVLNPMERQGVDFWWLDWQQWMESKFTPGLSNTFWLNYTFFHHAEQQNPALRPFIYHRWGGLGSHRYPLAFSGDTYAKWETLAFLPYFTATSSNVNYGYWGHDIGGHMFKKETKATDPELYTRWLQYGVFTPIFKTHSTKDPRIERYLWFFPDHLFVMRDAIRLRYTLAPYVYNAARENYDTGVGMCRPMYYDHPERDEAYNVPEQFMFGNDILATAVVEPVDSVTGLARLFPHGVAEETYCFQL